MLYKLHVPYQVNHVHVWIGHLLSPVCRFGYDYFNNISSRIVTTRFAEDVPDIGSAVGNQSEEGLGIISLGVREVKKRVKKMYETRLGVRLGIVENGCFLAKKCVQGLYHVNDASLRVQHARVTCSCWTTSCFVQLHWHSKVLVLGCLYESEC